MPPVLKRRLTKDDTTDAIMKAIVALAADKRSRVSMDDQIAWLETKLREISRLGRILRSREHYKRHGQ